VGVGEPVELTIARDKISYDGIVTGLDPNEREYRQRNPRGGYEPPVKTDVLTLANAAGQVEERLLKEDQAKIRAHRDWVKKEKDLLNTAIEPPTGTGAARGGMQPLPTGPGRGGFGGDPRMGPGGPPGFDPRRGPGRGGMGPGRGGDPRFGGD
jgi:hypothetical protein